MALIAPPNDIVIANFANLVDFLQRASLALQAIGGPYRVTSWYRDPRVNVKVGGEPFSQHLIGTALDIVPDDGDRAHLVEHAQDAGIIGIDEGTHVHLQLFAAGQGPRFSV